MRHVEFHYKMHTGYYHKVQQNERKLSFSKHKNVPKRPFGISLYRAIMAKATPATPTSPAMEFFMDMAPFLLLDPDVGEAPPDDEAPVEVDEPPAVGVADASG